jgi:hypothetical protein
VNASRPEPARSPRRSAALLARVLAPAALGVTAALLISCGSSGKGLIPVAQSGPLQSDFEEVAQAAQSGNGNCAPTELALAKTLHDFAQLPSSIDEGLRKRLQEGIVNLRTQALALCAQPLSSTTTGTTAKTTTTPTTTTIPTTTATTPTQTTPTQTTPPQTPPQETAGGGTAAPGETPAGGGTGAGEGNGNGHGNGKSGGVGPEGGGN